MSLTLAAVSAATAGATSARAAAATATAAATFLTFSAAPRATPAVVAWPRARGLHSFHFSAQLEPCLTQESTLHTLNGPQHPLNTGYTIPARTPNPVQSAEVELKCGRV